MPVVCYHGGLAMHQPFGADDIAAERLTDGLVAETNAEYRNTTSGCLDEGDRYAGFAGSAGARRDDDGLRL